MFHHANTERLALYLWLDDKEINIAYKHTGVYIYENDILGGGFLTISEAEFKLRSN